LIAEVCESQQKFLEERCDREVEAPNSTTNYSGGRMYCVAATSLGVYEEGEPTIEIAGLNLGD
jgi:hypothetical protein